MPQPTEPRHTTSREPQPGTESRPPATPPPPKPRREDDPPASPTPNPVTEPIQRE